jgi:hypothetical protein
MAWLIKLALLACTFLAGGCLVWRCRGFRGITIRDRYPATSGQGERTMTTETAGTEPERVIRWMEETPKVFDGVRRILDACDRATEATRRAQAERDRVLQECQALREQVRDLQTDLARLQKERTEAARWFAAMVREAAERFPPAPPPA